MRTTFVGISIEFQAAHRHTVCSNLPFPGIHSRKVVRLSGGLPHHLSGLVRNDREFDTAPVGPTNFQFIALLFHNTDAFGMENRFDLFFTDPAFWILQEGRMMTA